MTDFRDLVDVEGMEPEEEARLRRVHELLLEAGPPAELPPALTTPGAPPHGEIVPFPVKRRPLALVLVAAAIAAAAFGGGYLAGHSKKSASFTAARVVQMRPEATGGAGFAVLKVAAEDKGGNWPMEMTVRGLPAQRQRAAYYELWLTKDGTPTAPCGTFRVHGSATTVRLSVPYPLRRFDGWVVTRQTPGGREPGPVVLTT